MSNTLSRPGGISDWASYYHFVTGPVAGSYRISVRNVQSDLGWSILHADLWTMQICDQYETAAEESCASPPLDANTSYYLRVSEMAGMAGTFTLVIEPPAPPQ